MSGPEENPVLAHLATRPRPQRDTLLALRAVLLELVPDGVECISYRMPCVKVDGMAVAGYEAFAKHCSYFPHSGSVLDRVRELPEWCSVASKGTLQFPVDRVLPTDLVAELVRLRSAEVAAKRARPRRRRPDDGR
jgi:uncharacterized protein YdhG (YjbR/CyaY superfamily)